MSNGLLSSSFTPTDGSQYLGDGLFRQTIVTNQRNSAGWLWNMKGVDLERYKQNPTVLWSHGEYVLGKTERLEISDSKIVAYYRYAEGDPLADRMKHLDMNGFLPAASIGAMPTKYTEVQQGFDFHNWQLFEWSKCAVGLDPYAVQ